MTQNDGNFIFYDPASVDVWQSGEGERRESSMASGGLVGEWQ